MFYFCAFFLLDSNGKLEALGMEWGYIADAQITGSGNTYEYYPSEARLHNVNGFWSATIKDEIWLQIDFLELVGITGIQTQGAGLNVVQWVKTLQIHTGYDVNSITPIMDGNDPMVSNLCLPISFRSSWILQVNILFYQANLTKVAPEAQRLLQIVIAVVFKAQGCNAHHYKCFHILSRKSKYYNSKCT